MHSFARILVTVSWVGSAVALAGPAPTPPPTPAPAAAKAPAKAPAAPGSKHITLKFQGTLREALKAIADKGGINLVITGELKEPAEVYLNDVAADEALQTVADAHALKVRRQGSIWTIRPLTAEERENSSDEADEAAGDDHQDNDVEEDHREALAAPVPPVPPDPPDVPDVPDVASAEDDNDIPDPVADPKGFQRHIEERVQRDLRAKLMRKLRSKHFGSHGGRELVGTGHLVVEEHETVGDAVSYGGGMDVKGHVEGDAVAFGGGVHLGPRAEVEGDVLSFGGGISKEDGASVEGEEIAFGGGGFGRMVASTVPMVVRPGHDKHEHNDTRPGSGGLPGFLVGFALLFGGGFLSMMFAPNRMRLLEAELRREPLRCGITGFLGMLGLPLLTLALVISIVGILVVPVLWVVVALGCLMGIAALANEIGTRLPLKNVRKTQAVVLALGVLLMEVVGLIPVLGGITWAAIAFLSLGAIIRSRFGTRELGSPVPL
ncbi:MAG TPA: hypothetical protein VND93_18790 [Myxococcales bacterium]|nr:hypothetical protein [Myxococcales bacterium]